MLTFDPKEMPKSLGILDAASRDLEDGLFHALKAWSMMSLIMEDRLEETPDTLSAIRGELDRAQWLAPADAMINGVSASVRAILFEDYAQASRQSATALRAQPNNIFAMQAMTLCRFHAGDHEAAYRLSNKNRNVADVTKYGAMCNLHHALLCLRTQRPEEALETARAAVEAVPAYRAPNRQLVALYAAAGRPEAAQNQAAHLQQIEPEFSVERLLEDHSYPAHTLRETGTLEQARKTLATPQAG